MDEDDLDFTQDVLTLECPECSVVGEIRQILYKNPDGSEDMSRVICMGEDEPQATFYACTNCNWTY